MQDILEEELNLTLWPVHAWRSLLRYSGRPFPWELQAGSTIRLKIDSLGE